MDPWSQPGQLAFTAAAFTVAEAAGTASISVARSGGSNGAVSATCTAATLGSNTATAGSDYTAGAVTLNWADGDAANKTCSVTITNDSAVEGNETFTVTLGNATGGATLARRLRPVSLSLTMILHPCRATARLACHSIRRATASTRMADPSPSP